MENSEQLLAGSSDVEKGAYLGALASLATADREASEEEIEYLEALCSATNLPPEQREAVLTAATEISPDDLAHCLDVLKSSDLKYSFITDLIAFAKSDSNYSEEEEQHVQKLARYLGVDEKQYNALNQFAEKASSSKVSTEQMGQPSFLSSLGMNDQLQAAGINGSSLLKGLIGIAGPLILSKMLSGGRRGGGMFGGGGGMFGGRGGGMFGGSGGMGSGGLGSLIGMLSGGRGMGSLGGILGGILGGRR